MIWSQSRKPLAVPTGVSGFFGAGLVDAAAATAR